jgi:hypothetical protein
MPRLGDDNDARNALDAARANAKARATWLPGRWEGGRIFLNEFGEEVFLPLGIKREAAAFAGPLTFLGDGIRNQIGWAPEVVITNPVQGAV